MSTRSVSSRSGHSVPRSVGRGAFATALAHRAGLYRSTLTSSSSPAARRQVLLPLISDRRFWDPAAVQTAAGELYSPRTVSGGYTRLIAQPVASRRAVSSPSLRTLYYPTAQVAFEAPRRVAVCVRRHVRRQVLFARGRLGHGSPPVRRGRRTFTSSISCRG